MWSLASSCTSLRGRLPALHRHLVAKRSEWPLVTSAYRSLTVSAVLADSLHRVSHMATLNVLEAGCWAVRNSWWVARPSPEAELKNQAKTQEFITKLIVQGMLMLLEDEVEVRCRAADDALVTSCLPGAQDCAVAALGSTKSKVPTEYVDVGGFDSRATPPTSTPDRIRIDAGVILGRSRIDPRSTQHRAQIDPTSTDVTKGMGCGRRAASGSPAFRARDPRTQRLA